jgi:hypothetical protein
MKGVSMLILKAKLLSIYKSMDYVNKETGETTLGKVKLQLMSEIRLKNGETKQELKDISIPNEKLSLFKDKVGQVVSVEVNLIAKQYTFYGV